MSQLYFEKILIYSMLCLLSLLSNLIVEATTVIFHFVLLMLIVRIHVKIQCASVRIYGWIKFGLGDELLLIFGCHSLRELLSQFGSSPIKFKSCPLPKNWRKYNSKKYRPIRFWWQKKYMRKYLFLLVLYRNIIYSMLAVSRSHGQISPLQAVWILDKGDCSYSKYSHRLSSVESFHRSVLPIFFLSHFWFTWDNIVV